MGRQAVVRTYPSSFSDPTKSLSEYLKHGYKVIAVNKIADEVCENLEYILELDDKAQKEDCD